MISKILLTLAVIVIALVYLKQRKEAEQTASRSQAATAKTKQPMSDYRVAAYLFLIVMIGLAGAVYFFNWQDDHRIITVTLHGDADPVVYEVYQYQLQNRSFITTDGVVVNVASNERMVVEGLEP